MGYGFYTLPDGREAGYLVSAICDHPECTEQIDRGLSYVCGNEPVHRRETDHYGCGNYYCDEHQFDHSCPRPLCGEYSASGDDYCALIKGHDLPHRDDHSGIEFIETETDYIERNAVSDPTPETDAQFDIESLLQAAITEKLPANPTPEEISETVAAAAAILRGAGYRRVVSGTHRNGFNTPSTFDL